MATRILAVEDEPHILQMLELKLTEAGYEVRTARNGREAMAVVADTGVDLVVTDLQMPEVDGFELWCALRSDPSTSMVPVILITAVDPGDVPDELAADCTVMYKPFTSTELVAAVRERLGDPTSRDCDEAEAA